ncbi:MAG TPA: DUF554 family protein [Verrucomicrobiae bacterium]|nr:DUF554 family protein [Verrucomicrobiae bacterium]
MTGTILNAVGILLGGLLGLLLARQFTAPTQLALRGLMGVLTVFLGLRITWESLNGNFFQMFKQLVVVVLALMLGRLLGRLLQIQRTLNRLGQYASRRFAEVRPDDPNRMNEGFVICALLYCAGPLGPIGAVADGLTGYWQPLAIKMVMDGLAAMGFVSIFGWGVLLSAFPVFVYQGTITLVVHRFEPFLREHSLVDSINAVDGLLVFCVSLIVLELKKLELADYLPSLVMAPLITWLWQ